MAMEAAAVCWETGIVVAETNDRAKMKKQTRVVRRQASMIIGLGRGW